MTDKKYIAVYCGSNTGRNPKYKEGAEMLAVSLTNSNYHLIYGAGNVGLMGIIADKMLSLNQEVIGVIPHHLVQAEVAHMGCTEFITTEDMHTRKAIMADRADGFIAMPGGFGTLDEMMEVLTWAQLGLHKKPMGFLNTNGYFDALLQMINHMIDEGFVKPEQKDFILVDEDPSALVHKMKNYTFNYIPKWIK